MAGVDLESGPETQPFPGVLLGIRGVVQKGTAQRVSFERGLRGSR